MYLTKVTVKDNGLGFRNQYAHHQNIWKLFSFNPDKERDFLFRVISSSISESIYLVLSAECPDMSDQKAFEIEIVSDSIGSFNVGDVLHFNLCVNPIVRTDGKKHSILRHRTSKGTVITPKEWLTRKASDNGFKLINCDVSGFKKIRFDKKGEHGFVTGIDFKGTLEVVDSTLFDNAFTRGIGPSKSFGFGLIAPV